MVENQDSTDSISNTHELSKQIEYIANSFYFVLEFLGEGPDEWAEVLIALKDLTPAEIIALCETYKEIKNHT